MCADLRRAQGEGGLLTRLASPVEWALATFALGRIWVWYLFGMNNAPWRLVAPSLVAVGVVANYLPFLRRVALVPMTASIGLYAGWLVRALLLADVTGGPGLEFMVAGMVLGAAAGAQSILKPVPRRSSALRGAFFGGLAGSFILNPVVSYLVTIPRGLISPMAGAPCVIMCATLGLLMGALWPGRRSRQEAAPTEAPSRPNTKAADEAGRPTGRPVPPAD